MEKQTVYIKVNVKDRLPKEFGYYLTDVGMVHFKGWFNNWIEYWLEEIEPPIPSDILTEGVKQGYISENLQLDAFINGANFILNHLKSNTNG